MNIFIMRIRLTPPQPPKCNIAQRNVSHARVSYSINMVTWQRSTECVDELVKLFFLLLSLFALLYSSPFRLMRLVLSSFVAFIHVTRARQYKNWIGNGSRKMNNMDGRRKRKEAEIYVAFLERNRCARPHR